MLPAGRKSKAMPCSPEAFPGGAGNGKELGFFQKAGGGGARRTEG